MADSIYEVVGWWVTIGNAVSGGTANTILFSDASTNLADSTDLFWDDVLKIFHVWDFGLAANSTFMSLDDQNSLITNQTDGVFKVVNSSGDRLILVDVVNWDYWIGDIDGILNSTRFVIDDTTKAASIAAGWDRMRLDINGTAFTSKLWDTGAVGNSTILVVDDATANKKVTSTGIEISIVAGAINFTHAPSSDSMGRTTGFTWTATTTYTITVAGSWVDFDWTDGTNSGTNVPMDAPNQTLLSNWISVYFVEFGTYTPWDYYTFTFTVSNVGVQWLLLDYKNATYSIGDTTAARSKARLTVNDVWWGIQAITDWWFSVRNSANTNTIFSAGGSSVSFGISTWVWYTFTGTSSKSDNDWIIADSSVANIGIFSVRDGNYNNSWWLWIDPMSWDYYFWDQYNNRTRIYIDDDTSTFNVNSIWLVKIWDTSSANNSTLLTVDDTNSRITVSKPFWLKGYTVATLPTWFTGATAYVTDALAPAFGSTVVWWWAVVIKVFYNGSNRIVW